MDTERYCKTLDNLNRMQAVRAIHEALLQLQALTANVDCEHFDNNHAIQSLAECLKTAGHTGFVEEITRCIGGSILNSTPAQLTVTTDKLAFCVRPSPELDTHFLSVTHRDGTSLLAEHPNGHSCLELAKRLGDDTVRAKAQWQYIQDCGGMCRPWSVFEHFLSRAAIA